jgi:hypothetical protein
MHYDPNDRNQRHILIWTIGTNLLEAEHAHRMRTGYGGGLSIIGKQPETSDQEAFALCWPRSPAERRAAVKREKRLRSRHNRFPTTTSGHRIGRRVESGGAPHARKHGVPLYKRTATASTAKSTT